MIHLIKERMEARVRKNLKLGDILNINVRSGALKECEVIGIYPHIVAVRYQDNTRTTLRRDGSQRAFSYLIYIS